MKAILVATLAALLMAGCGDDGPALDENGCSGYIHYNHTAMWGDTDKSGDPNVCYVDHDPGQPYGGPA